MPGARWPSRMIRLGPVGVAPMALVVPAILLARCTTSHDWYVAGKLTAVEITPAVGFREYTTVAHRRKHGDTWNVSRAVFVRSDPSVLAWQRILLVIGDGVMLGVGGAVLRLMLLGAAGNAASDGSPGDNSEVAPGGEVAEWTLGNEGPDGTRGDAAEGDGAATAEVPAALSGEDGMRWRRGR